ncbi:Slp family lipoprotein, partial [Vibrio cholerae]
TYGEGRLLTLYGTTAPSEQGKVGDYEHTYPVMNAQGYHLWRVEERVQIDDIEPYMFPCRGFYCWPRTMSERDGKIIQEVK